MSNRLYLIPLPDAQTTTADESVAAQIQQSGLLEQGGTAVEKIAAENIDLVVNGQWRFGETFSQKLADELESLGESSYVSLPFYDPDASDSGRNKGYYELESVDVNPAQPSTRDVFEYSAGLIETGTREEHWRAVETSSSTNINTGLATSGNGLVGIPATATKVRWFDRGQGTEAASIDTTVTGEFADVDRYDPAASTFDDPTLIYEVDYADESPTDVRVFDDLGTTKYYTVNGTDFNRWVHAFHSAFEFTGNPIVDNGLLRLEYDESNGQIAADEWDAGTSSWADLATVGGATADYELVDADLWRYGPAAVHALCTWEDTSDGSQHDTDLRVERGVEKAILRQPTNGTIPGDLETMLDPIVSNQATDAQPDQTLVPRSEVR